MCVAILRHIAILAAGSLLVLLSASCTDEEAAPGSSAETDGGVGGGDAGPQVGAEGTVESTMIRDTEPHALDGQYGRGVSVHVSQESGERSSLTLRGCRIARSHEVGVVSMGSDTFIDATAVLDTRPRQVDGVYGAGIVLQLDFGSLEWASGTIERSLVERAHAAGVVVAGAEIAMTDVIVRYTRPQQQSMDFGDGIDA